MTAAGSKTLLSTLATLATLALTLAGALVGCERSKAASAHPAGNAMRPAPAAAVSQTDKATGKAPDGATGEARAAAAKPGAGEVTAIVFVGRADACDCTRKAVDTGWAELQKALGSPNRLAVERLDIDTDSSRVSPYQKQRAIMALPAIYFIDRNGEVIEMLQGELSLTQISRALETGSSAP